MRSTRRAFIAIACFLAAFSSAPGQDKRVASEVTAIDILLAPDDVMIDRGHEEGLETSVSIRMKMSGVRERVDGGTQHLSAGWYDVATGVSLLMNGSSEPSWPSTETQRSD